MDEVITVKQAYEAMFDFLENVFNRTQSDALGVLLGGMSTTEDGKPADSAIWDEWMVCVKKSKAGKISTKIDLS